MVTSAAIDDSRTPARYAARMSVIAAFVCFTLNCVLNQFILKQQPASGKAWNLVVGSVSTLVVLGGIGLGIYGLVAGWRRRSLDTAMIALLGILLNLGILAVMAWALYVLSLARGM